jgi:hypothetical protein
MKSVLLAAAVAALATAFAPSAVDAQTSFELRKQQRAYRQARPGYSKLRKSDLIETKKFRDPNLSFRAQGEPFDNGFFFETPRGPFGGYTPYMH